MPRISTLSLDQVNRQIDQLDTVQKQVSNIQQQTSFLEQQVSISDPIHAPQTTNNLIFTWTGSTTTLSWPQGFIKDKNWNVQTIAAPTLKSTSKGQQHLYTVKAGSLSLLASTPYWLGWDGVHQVMLANKDASKLHSVYNVHLICQITTGTAAQTGVAGGGGSSSVGSSDLSGAIYNTFTANTSNVIVGTTSGLLLQAGTTTSTHGSGGGSNPVTFPTAFSGTPRVTVGNYSGSANIDAGSTTTTGFTWEASSVGQQLDWIAVGAK
jgi:hypothetical protein